MKNHSNKGIALPFNWIFAIIAGIFILFIAIYFASQFISTGQKITSTETAAKLIAYLNPLESGFASGLKPEEINFKKETRTYFSCNSDKNIPWGEETLAFAEKGFGDEFGQKSLEVPIKNKYVFAENIVEGKRINVFSKPFSTGFLVGDIIVISSKDYCFFKSPNEFRDTLEGMSNIKFEDNNMNNCTGVKVCFSDNNECDMIVKDECFGQCEDFYFGSVLNKNTGNSLTYIGNLVYGAIFSSAQIYDCNVQRLMKRLNQVGSLYVEKSKILNEKGCSLEIESDINNLRETSLKITSSKGLNDIYDKINTIDSINKASEEGCKLY